MEVGVGGSQGQREDWGMAVCKAVGSVFGDPGVSIWGHSISSRATGLVRETFSVGVGSRWSLTCRFDMEAARGSLGVIAESHTDSQG